MSFAVSTANRSTTTDPRPISQTAPGSRDLFRLLNAGATRSAKNLPTLVDVGSRGELLVLPNLPAFLPLSSGTGDRSVSDTSTPAEHTGHPDFHDLVFAHLTRLFCATDSTCLDTTAEEAFELLFQHENSESRSKDLSRLVRRLAMENLLDVAGRHYEKYGNEDRLRLASRLVAAAGRQSFSALLAHLQSRPNDTIYFLGVIIDRGVFDLEQQKRLVDLAVSLNDPDVDEVLTGSAAWMSRELSEYVDALEQQKADRNLKLP